MSQYKTGHGSQDAQRHDKTAQEHDHKKSHGDKLKDDCKTDKRK